MKYYRVYVDKHGIVYAVKKIGLDELISKPRQHHESGGWDGTFNYAPKIGDVITL